MRSLMRALLIAAILAGGMAGAASAQQLPPFLARLDGDTAGELGQSLADRVGAAHPKGSSFQSLVDDLMRQGFLAKVIIFNTSLPKEAVAPAGWGENAGKVHFYADRYFEAGRCLWEARVFWSAKDGTVGVLAARVEPHLCY